MGICRGTSGWASAGLRGGEPSVEENLGALDVSLTAEELREIDDIAPQGVAAGARYAEAAMRAVNR